MSLASLEAFLEQAHSDERLQEQLVFAPDAAAVAAIAQAAGYAVSELDLWQASAATPAELLPYPEEIPPDSDPFLPDLEDGLPTSVDLQRPFEGRLLARETPLPAKSDPWKQKASPLPDPWLEEDPISGFLHQAQGDEALQQALATAPDAAAVAAIAQAAGYPISELDLWRASAATPEELLDSARSLDEPMPEPMLEEVPIQQPFARESVNPRAAAQDPMNEGVVWSLPTEEALLGFLHQAQGDEALQQALASAPDAEAVAAIARAAGYPISALDLWRAGGGTHAEDLLPLEPDLSALEAPLARFLLEAEHDPALQQALAVAEDAAAVAAIAQAAGYPISAADLWEASDALPEELLITEFFVFQVEDDLPN